MGMFLNLSDLAPFATIDDAKAAMMIDDAEAMAAVAAPCLAEAAFQADPVYANPVRAILRAAVLRWNESGNGAIQQETVGPFSHTIDTRSNRRGMFYPSEIEQLQELCARFSGKVASGAYAIDMAPQITGHLLWCAYELGANYCSCGYDIAGHPIYEVG